MSITTDLMEAMSPGITHTDSPRIFLTDYASYNNGTQFEFGHWVDLDDHDDAEALNAYMTKHFADADKKSPLDGYGSKREERMITDYEGFPRDFYSECMSFEALYDYLELDDDDKIRYEMAKDQGYDDVKEWDRRYHAVDFFNDRETLENIYEEMHPDFSWDNIPAYFTFNSERFKDEQLTEFTAENGQKYLIEDQ